MAVMRAAILAFLLPAQAHALSCLPWHVEDAFQEADASPDRYLVVTGTLAFQAADLPQVDWDRQEEVPPETRLDARLSGKARGRSDTSMPFDARVRLVVECSGPWCPQLEPGAEYLAFVNTTETPYEVKTGACGGMVFLNPDAEMLERVQNCLDGAYCTPPER